MAGENFITTSGIDKTILENPVHMIEEVMRYFGMKFECCLPAIVEKYDRNSHLALVRPLVNMVSSKGEQLERDLLNVPVRRIQHGEFLVDFPLYPGETGWVIAADRETENALLSNMEDTTSESTGNSGPQRPATYHIHKYRFGFFIPDRWGEIPISGTGDGYDDKAVIMSANGKTKIILSKNGDMTIDLAGGGGNSNLVINSNVLINGNAVFVPKEGASVSITQNGISSEKDVVAGDGISLASHYHYDSFNMPTSEPMPQTPYDSGVTRLLPGGGTFQRGAIIINIAVVPQKSFITKDDSRSVEYEIYANVVRNGAPSSLGGFNLNFYGSSDGGEQSQIGSVVNNVALYPVNAPSSDKTIKTFTVPNNISTYRVNAYQALTFN